MTSVTAIRERNALKEGVRSFWQAGALDKRMPEAKPEKPDLETKCPITGETKQQWQAAVTEMPSVK